MSLHTMLTIVQCLEETFHHRNICSHHSDEKFKIFMDGTQQNVIVLNPELSKQILTSKNFIAFNYFDLGVKRLAAKDRSIQLLADFYEENILFKEGEDHHRIKKAFNGFFEKLCSELETITPRIIHFFEKRKNTVNSPIHFTTAFTRICTGYFIARLTTIPLKKVYQALKLRQNVFAIYFQPSRHKALGAVLHCLYEETAPPTKNHPQWLNHLLAQHLITMGIDPLIGGICGNIIENNKSSFAEAIHRYCPTSFVVRKCIQAVTVEKINFNRNDICYVSLLPGQKETSNSCPMSLPFGIGQHTCIGKQFSLSLLTLAEKVVKEVFNHRFKNTSIIAPTGAFLSFKDDLPAAEKLPRYEMLNSTADSY